MNNKIEKITAEINELKKVVKTLTGIAKSAIENQIKQLENNLFELTKYEKAVTEYYGIRKNHFTTYDNDGKASESSNSTRDSALHALLIVNGGKASEITVNDIKQVLSLAGVELSANDNQYNQTIQFFKYLKNLNYTCNVTFEKVNTEK